MERYVQAAGPLAVSAGPGAARLAALAHPPGCRAARIVFAVLVAAVLTAWVPASPAQADEPPSTQAAMLVEQALALIANGAGDARVSEALRAVPGAPDKQGVDMADVTRALSLIDRPGQDPAVTARARGLLLESIGGKLPSAATARNAVGTETGTSVILPEVKPVRGISDGGDAVLLGLSLAAVLAGLYLAWRLRPPHTLHQLIHPAGGRDQDGGR